MQTLYGEVDEDDIFALQFKLDWYLRYGNLPSCHKRATDVARADYGRQYERYVGYLFESRGFTVSYRGISEEKEDGGIDLVAKAPRKIRLIQCKRWRNAVNVDVISRLQGAVERFIYEERKGKTAEMRTSIRGVIACSGGIAKEAEDMSRHFGIYVMSNLQYQYYPAIKAQRITDDAGRFLLPFSTGYDRMKLNLKRGDRLFYTVREAFSDAFYYPQYNRNILREIYNRIKPK